jgi:arabinoxylan arabinofuranohydrolase
MKASLLPALLSSLVLRVLADNPIVQTIYTTDPAPLVYNNRVYVYTGHDEDGATTYVMKDWHVYSTADMVNWQDHGSPLSLANFAWANANAWAGQVIPRNGKFYYYVPVRHTTGQMAIGVAVGDSPTGPFRDAIGKPLVETNEIDPTVYIDDDGQVSIQSLALYHNGMAVLKQKRQAWLMWGNPNLWYVKLNSDMISTNGSPAKITLTTAGFGTRSGNAQRPTTFEEAPWLYKRNGIWYLIYAANCCSEDIRYSTSTSSPLGPYTYRGVIMPTQGKSFTNHPGIVDYKGNSYFFYHNGALPGGGGYQRSVAVERFVYNSDGTIPQIQMTTAGPLQLGTFDPYTRQEAETMAFSSGVETETCADAGGGMQVSHIDNGDYIKVKGVGFGSPGPKSFSARVSSGSSGGKIELRLGGTSGTLIGTCNVPGTGSWTSYTTVTCSISGAAGTQDLYLRFTGGSGSLFNFNWWQFDSGSGSTTPLPSSTGGGNASQPASTSTRAPPPASSTPIGNCAALYGQCGGSGWTGPTCCSSGTCKYSNDWYSQCL